MNQTSRRKFVQGTLLAGAGAWLPASLFAQTTRHVWPNDVLRIATSGVHGRGASHVGEFSKMSDVHVAAICDIDSKTIRGVTATAEKGSGKKPAYFQDYRKMMEDKSIDAVSIATTNQWHALQAIWACQAGKHVYVEKPLSHNVFEGRKLVEAARKYNCLVQHGTQSRSSHRPTMAAIHAGALGKVSISRGLCYKRRKSIGHTPESPVPEGVDYDIWLGPAPVRPFTRNRFHYNWHWHWDYGNGDIGNQGVHEMDKARWGLNVGLPVRVMCVGGRLGYEDDGETPNTQIACLDYGDGRQLIFEVRGLETAGFMGESVGNLYHGEKGHVSGQKFHMSDGSKVELKGVPAEHRLGGGNHFRNFIESIKTGKVSDLNADVLEGHLSCALIHIANISYRLGQPRPLDAKEEPFGKNDAGNDAFRRMKEHLKENGVDLAATKYVVGRDLAFDPKAEKFVNDAEADKMLTREYRKPYVVPENV